MPVHYQTCAMCGTFQMMVAWDDKTALCPDCGEPTVRTYAAVSTFRDDIPGGIVVENYGPKPIRFDSHTERRRYMREHGLQERERYSPMPGTDKDPQGIPNPKGYVDPYTLEAGRILIERQQQAGRGEPEFDGSKVLTDMQTGTISERDVVSITSGDPRRQSRLHRRMTRD